MKDINEAIKVKRKPHSVLFFKAMQTNNKQKKLQPSMTEEHRELAFRVANQNK